MLKITNDIFKMSSLIGNLSVIYSQQLLIFMVPPLVSTFTNLTCNVSCCVIRETRLFYHWLRVNGTESFRFKDLHNYLPADLIYYVSLWYVLFLLKGHLCRPAFLPAWPLYSTITDKLMVTDCR